MPKVSEEHRLARRSEILEAAATLFARQGFDGTSMADIIAESGLSAGAIYGHFKSKSDLVENAVIELFVRRAEEFGADALSGDAHSPGVLVATFLRRMREEFATPSLLLQVWASAVGEPQLHALATRIVGNVSSVFARYLTLWYRHAGLDEASASARGTAEARVCLGICQGYMVQAALVEDFDADAYLAAIGGLLDDARTDADS